MRKRFIRQIELNVQNVHPLFHEKNKDPDSIIKSTILLSYIARLVSNHLAITERWNVTRKPNTIGNQSSIVGFVTYPLAS